MDGPDVFYVNRSAALGFEWDIFYVFDAFDIAASANVVLGGSDFKNLIVNVVVRHADFVDDFVEWDVVGEEFIGIHIYLILFDEFFDWGDFGNVFYGFKNITK